MRPGCALRRLIGRICGRVVLWQCESGSGASLGACDSRSVIQFSDWGLMAGPVVRLTCLTGMCCSVAGMLCMAIRKAPPTVWTTRVQRRDERFYQLDPRWIARAIDWAAIWDDRVVLRKTQIFPGYHPYSSIGENRCCGLRMVSVHGEAAVFGPASGISSIRRAFGGCLGTRRR
jgi:hypothetical protein